MGGFVKDLGGSGGVYVCLCCEPGLVVEMAGPGICVLCSAGTFAS